MDKHPNLGTSTDGPKHRQYCIIESRIASFDNWPENKTQDKKQLSEAGFVYTGIDDFVRCFYCNIGLRDWPEGACPWKQHILVSPSCGHVIQCKGKDYVRQIFDETEHNSDDVIDENNKIMETMKVALERREAVDAAKEDCSNEDIMKREQSLTRQNHQHILSSQTVSRSLSDYLGKSNSRNQTNQGGSVTNQAKYATSKFATLGILTDRPKHRQYGIIDSRIASFENWPKNKTQERKQLAEAGFFYTGKDDSVRCFYCNIGLRDWPEGACPWEQHIFANRSCGHVLQCKGKGYIKQILGDSEHDSGEDIDDSGEIIDTVHIAMTRNQEAVMVAKEFCSNEDIMKKAIKTLIREDIHRTFKAVELLKAICDIEKAIYTDLSRDDQDIIDTDSEDSESEEDIEEANRTLKDQVTCKICFDAIACIITLPCGHMVSCSQCISALTTCAICGVQIKGTVRARMAI